MLLKCAIVTLSVVMLIACGNEQSTTEKTSTNQRSYERWEGTDDSLKIDFAAAYYYQNSDNITAAERDTLIENGMTGLNNRAKKIITCTSREPRLQIDDNADYFEAIIKHCMVKLGL